METARDSIKYVRPVYSKTFNGNELVDKTEDWNRLYEDDAEDERNNINTDKYRRPLYESTEDRISQELAEVIPTFVAGHDAAEATENTPAVEKTNDKVVFQFKAVTEAEASAAIEALTGAEVTPAGAKEYSKASQKWGANGEKFLDGYTVIYYNNNEQDVIAIQDKATNKFMLAGEYAKFLSVDADKVNGVYTLEVEVTGTKPEKFDVKKVNAFARYNSEDDYEGDYLGEVEIKMSDYEFRPRPTSIGVSWNQMSEVVLDTSFGISTEETLVTYASQAIRMHLDYQAVKMAYRIAKVNPEAYHVTFDAAYNSAADARLEGYIHNAQTFPQALETIGDIMLNDINRGGVSKIVCGPSAGTYLTLVNGFVSKGNYTKQGIHQFGTLNGLEAYKAPSSVIKTNDILTIFKNPENESDVSIAFGTLVPFFSTGTIQRKNFFKEVGLSTLGDWHCINRRYLALITIDGLKPDALTSN